MIKINFIKNSQREFAIFILNLFVRIHLRNECLFSGFMGNES